jgi:hypothetical protein
MRKEGHSYSWILNFVQKFSFLWSKKKNSKKAMRMKEFQNIF